MPQEQRLLKYAVYISNCSAEALNYGRCVSEKAEKVTKANCEKEFTLFFNCFKKQSSKLLFNQHLFQIVHYFRPKLRVNEDQKPPFRVLLDGTFAMAALSNKINLREQMPKYLNQEVEMCVTPCILEELKKLGKETYGALYICQQFKVENCPHKPVRTASECIRHLARRMKEKTKYFIATQDPGLTDALREIPGVPILFIKYQGILIDKASEATIKEIERPKTDLDTVKALKKEILGEDENAKERKRKHTKGPNPLSVKKKKRITAPSSSSSATKTASGKRKRRKKSNRDSNVEESAGATEESVTQN